VAAVSVAASDWIASVPTGAEMVRGAYQEFTPRVPMLELARAGEMLMPTACDAPDKSSCPELLAVVVLTVVLARNNFG